MMCIKLEVFANMSAAGQSFGHMEGRCSGSEKEKAVM
jgi:hypothetical protein